MSSRQQMCRSRVAAKILVFRNFAKFKIILSQFRVSQNFDNTVFHSVIYNSVITMKYTVLYTIIFGIGSVCSEIFRVFLFNRFDLGPY